MSHLMASVRRPTLLLDKERARRNIRRMAAKADASGVRFRPHFKTHQSAAIGEWFRDAGVKAITVSSLDMAAYFARNGWSDITIAFPANIRQIDGLNELAHQIQLNVLVESNVTAEALGHGLTHQVDAWLKVDTGYGRTGIAWNDFDTIRDVASTVDRTKQTRLAGLLTHAGHTYGAESTTKISEIHRQSVFRLHEAQRALANSGLQVALSIGDTPSCSVVPRFDSVDEIRPGNFVFYDVAQWSWGACQEDDIALAVACPVVAKHERRAQLVIYGGAVHLSKESIPGDGDRPIFGRVALTTEQGWSSVYAGSALISLSQEHGIVQAEPALLEQVAVGDLLVVVPIHSCLTANLMGHYLTLDGERIMMGRF